MRHFSNRRTRLKRGGKKGKSMLQAKRHGKANLRILRGPLVLVHFDGFNVASTGDIKAAAVQFEKLRDFVNSGDGVTIAGPFDSERNVFTVKLDGTKYRVNRASGAIDPIITDISKPFAELEDESISAIAEAVHTFALISQNEPFVEPPRRGRPTAPAVAND